MLIAGQVNSNWSIYDCFGLFYSLYRMATLFAEPLSLSSAENAENVFPREGGSASRVPNGKWSVENKCDG